MPTMKQDKKVIVVIPAYNAEKTIESVFRQVPKKTLKKIYQFIVVNDCSRDNTLKVLEKLKKTYNIKVISHSKNRGYGAAQKTGLRAALNKRVDIAVLLHSDGQLAPEEMERLMLPLENNEADLVQGSRILGKGALKGGMPLYKYIGNRILTLVQNIAYGMHMAEYHSGYLLYSRKVLGAIPFEKLSDDFHFDVEMLISSNKKGFRIKQVPIPTRYGNEKSHLNPIKYGLDILKTIFRYWTGKYDF